MSNDLIQYAFIAGELSPRFFGRTDLEKYDLGVALAYNYFVDYRGGLSTRPGLEFIGHIQHDDKDVKFARFEFSPNITNTYVLLFGDLYVRFIQDGGYILETSQSITSIIKASSAIVGKVAHGYSDGDWVSFSNILGMTELNNRIFEVFNKDANTFEIKDYAGVPVNTFSYGTFISGDMARVYTVVTPYAAADLNKLRVKQRRDTIRLTHEDFQIRTLVRIAATNWVLSIETFGGAVGKPTTLVGVPSAADASGMLWGVTAVDINGEESLLSTTLVEELSVNYTTTAGFYKLTWTAVTDAVSYNIYRSQIVDSGAANVTRAMQLGFLGISFGPEFIDNNIIPNFSIAPPEFFDPFADSSVLHIDVTAGGTGYTKASTVSVVGAPGSGFEGFPIVNTGGNVIAIVVTKGGSGYVSPVVTVTVGSSATFTVDLSPSSGNFPSLSGTFQQRTIYAASLNDPLTLWASKPGRPSNFDVSRVVNDGDSYEFELDSEEITPILHMVEARGGLLLLLQAGIWLLSGSGTNRTVTPTDALADPQSYTGCSVVEPLTIDTDILYTEDKGSTVRLLSFNDFSKVYGGQDYSILSNHFFDNKLQIEKWAFAQSPFRIVWGVRSDGAILAFTVVAEQNVQAWTQNWTKGLFKDVVSIEENKTDKVYVVVERIINDRPTKMIERFAERVIDNIENSWAVDSGLDIDLIEPNVDITFAAATGDGVQVEASANVFFAADVGKIIRGGGGKSKVVSRISGKKITVDIIKDLTILVPEDPNNTPQEILSGDWTMDAEVTIISGLWHLEGETVSVFADGNVQISKTVVDGSITIDAAASKVLVGLGFTCTAQSLPLISRETIIEGHRKRIVGTAVRIHDTRGLKIGPALNDLQEMKDRTTEFYGEPTILQFGSKYQLIDTIWDEEGQTFFVQDSPLPATILGFVSDTELGDEND